MIGTRNAESSEKKIIRKLNKASTSNSTTFSSLSPRKILSSTNQFKFNNFLSTLHPKHTMKKKNPPELANEPKKNHKQHDQHRDLRKEKNLEMSQSSCSFVIEFIAFFATQLQSKDQKFLNNDFYSENFKTMKMH
jgi:hypothetical protein